MIRETGETVWSCDAVLEARKPDVCEGDGVGISSVETRLIIQDMQRMFLTMQSLARKYSVTEH